MASVSTRGLLYSEWAIDQTHHAMVVTPEQNIEWGRSMLEALRVSIGNTERDAEIVGRFKEATSHPRVFVFRGSNHHGSARIELGEDLDAAEREELSYLLFRSHLPVLRNVMANGAQLFVYVDWEPDVLELFRTAMNRIAQERGAQLGSDSDPQSRRLLKLDQWILTRLTLYCAQPFDDVIKHLLPDSLPLFDRREERVARLLDGIPPESLELMLGRVAP